MSIPFAIGIIAAFPIAFWVIVISLGTIAYWAWTGRSRNRETCGSHTEPKVAVIAEA